KVLRDGAGDRLCDLSADPSESVWVTLAEGRRRHGAAPVDALLRAVEGAAVTPPRFEPAADPEPPMDARERQELERQLRLLGYM
ncbi:MAG TPA: hypothetical protein VFO60_03875, partial [Candidatus Dormibacteraeota bacterium]|nr:hypothetical protein [Candidatus Dormibacteraeota bacterium]